MTIRQIKNTLAYFSPFIIAAIFVTLLIGCVNLLKDFRKDDKRYPYWEKGIVEYTASRDRETLFWTETLYVLVIKVNDRFRVGKEVSKEVYLNCPKGSTYVNEKEDCI